MRVLTLWQPWAQLLVAGVKHFETRTWVPALRPGETVAIHAAANTPTEGLLALCDDLVIEDALADVGYRMPMSFSHHTRDQTLQWAPRGAVVGAVVFQGAHRTEAWKELGIGSLERALGDWSSGRYAWECIAPVMLDEPVPCKGRQAVWRLPEDVEEAVMVGIGQKAMLSLARGTKRNRG